MKSEYQLCYDRFVISNLCRMDLSIKERASLVHSFFQNSQAYYDSLCDNLYFQAAGDAPGQSLWITYDGQTYLSAAQRTHSDVCLLPEETCPAFEDDITEQLHLVCLTMQSRLSEE